MNFNGGALRATVTNSSFMQNLSAATVKTGGAVISERHANFIENAGGATSKDAVALMAEARRRVQEGFGVTLEHEVRFLGPLALPAL